MKYHEVSGSHYDLGLKIGQTDAELAKFTIRQYATYHAPFPRPGPCKRLTQALELAGKKFPWAIEEMRGIADGAGVPFEAVAFLQFFGFGRSRFLTTSCSNLVFTASDRGPLLAGNLDDPPIHHLVSFIPNHGCAYTFINWPGTLLTWSGMNERGLAISGSSASLLGEQSPKERPKDNLLQNVTSYLVNRIILKEAGTTSEAVEILRRPDIPGSGNHTAVDASGRAVVVEKTGFKLYGIREAENGWIACGNLFPSNIPLYDFSKDPVAVAHLSRYRSLERGGGGPHTFEVAKGVLGSHEGNPSKRESVCNNGTSCSVIYLTAEKKVYFTQRYPCQYNLKEYSVKERGII